MAVEQFDVCIVGGGPAGSVAGLRLVQLGHRVCLIERSMFPRWHVGESLTSGIWPIFDVLGVRESLSHERFLTAGKTLLRWAEPRTQCLEPIERGRGLLVDRSRFDAFLLNAAASGGVQIFQPGRIQRIESKEAGWQVEVSATGEAHGIRSTFLVDASGRNGFASGKRERVSARTVALCAYMQGQECPQETLVEALSDAWCWGSPIPGGLFSAMVFLDPQSLGPVCHGTLEESWRSRLAKAELFETISQLPLVRPVVAREATMYSAVDPISQYLVRVGEASFSLDPLSSTGVEKAMQTGLVAAIALHTMVVRPGSKELCIRFYGDRHKETVSTHAAWCSNFYAEVARFSECPFWELRSGVPENTQPELGPERLGFQQNLLERNAQVRISDRTRLVEEPCIIDDQICAQMALQHPSLGRPVAFVEGISICRLLEMVRGNMNLDKMLALWSGPVTPQQAHRIALWLVKHRVLEAVGSGAKEAGRPS
jgi:flavin-dependent dehydrogenase